MPKSTEAPKKSSEGLVVSRYVSGRLTELGIARVTAYVRASFPSLGRDFPAMLVEAMIRNQFSDERAIDAVNHVIDNCEYPEPTIARFISYDRKVRLYSHSDVCNAVSEQKAVWSDFEFTTIEGKKFWYLKSDNQ